MNINEMTKSDFLALEEAWAPTIGRVSDEGGVTWVSARGYVFAMLESFYDSMERVANPTSTDDTLGVLDAALEMIADGM